MDYPAHLPHDEQIALVRKAQAGDIAARNRLVATSMRAVVGRARALQKISPAMDLHDLVSEGSFGLMRAIEKFDPDRGLKFLTYAAPWIDNFIRGAAYDDREIKRSDVNRGKVLAEYRALVAGGVDHYDAIESVAAAHRMKPTTLELAVANRNRSAPVSLSTPLHEDGGATIGDTLAGTVAAADDAIEGDQRAQALNATLLSFRQRLSERERAILDRRVLADEEDAATLDEVGASFEISKERVRQIEKVLKQRLHRAMRRSHQIRDALGIDTDAGSVEAAQAYARDWWKRRKALGLCVCGSKARLGRATCGRHKRTAEQNRSEFARYKLAGLCHTHTRTPVEPGTTRCFVCNQRKRESAKRARDARRATGRCQLCGHPSQSGARCQPCKDARAHHNAKTPRSRSHGVKGSDRCNAQAAQVSRIPRAGVSTASASSCVVLACGDSGHGRGHTCERVGASTSTRRRRSGMGRSVVTTPSPQTMQR